MTAASSNHAQGLLNLVRSIQLSDVQAQVVAWDLGLAPGERDQVARQRGVTVHTFPFDRYPPHMNIEVAAGQYAWKPLCIADAAREHPGLVLWLDAGDLVFGDLTWTWRTIERERFYSPVSPGTVRRWVHPATLAALDAAPDLLGRKMRNGAVAGFDARVPRIAQMLDQWRQAALDVSIIAPPGSDRQNHRQDQSVLTVLYYQAQTELGFRTTSTLGEITLHNDTLRADDVEATIASLQRASKAQRQANVG